MDTPFTEKTCEAFVAVLSSAAPVPGGGGAAALVGAVGTALGAMAGNLTVGRKKYAAVEEDIRAAVKRAEALQKRLLELVEEDAAGFTPLSRAYAIPKDDPSRGRVLEDATAAACRAPAEMMALCCASIAFFNRATSTACWVCPRCSSMLAAAIASISKALPPSFGP